MTREELNYIKDSFSQILDDIGGNPDWYDAAKAVASDLGTIERQFEERVTKLPSNFDEAAEEYFEQYNYMPKGFVVDAFKAGAEWMAGQGETVEGTLGYGPHLQKPIIMLESLPEFYEGHCQEVIVQILKKQ